ncbi:hypothetical protein BEN48_01730 [Hymenobacter glacialis]|uniref:Glycosyltransferase RgtA/B/C/D-like domain-containing protein n=1 Tax=Hymenobacter glacialis TaxID=1908236 RepID=A0A1G1T3Y0_9BACT|nr:hypothetical protein BEN48_01730 [Hymenobacter glacialis]
MVGLAAAGPLFWLLGRLPAQQWDEARTGLNALEILVNGDALVLTHRGVPDLWNSKPPLLPWLQALSMLVLGPTELALRLPSALAALATVGAVYRAGSRWLGSWRAGLLAALVLLSAPGYVRLHVARTGDYDALLTLWTTLGALAWLAYAATGRARHAWGAGAAFALAVLTKGVAGLFFGPGLLAALWLTGQLRRLRAGAPGPGWGWWPGPRWPGTWGREAGSARATWPGVWQYEVGGAGRGGSGGGTATPVHWYAWELATAKFSYWLPAALAGAGLGWAAPRQSRAWWLCRVLGATAGTMLLVISLVPTKLGWYDAPAYPLLALLAAAGLIGLGRLVAASVAAQGRRYPRPAVRLLAVLLVAAVPYSAQLVRTRGSTDARLQEAALMYGGHLRAQTQRLPGLRDYALHDDGRLNDSPEFYAAVQRYQHGHRVARVTPESAVAGAAAPRVVVACGEPAQRTWQRYYRTRVLLRSDSCVTLQLQDRR